jgi:KUP system potassium uptake protein
VPIVIAAGLFAMMATWKRGRALLADSFGRAMTPLGEFIAGLGAGGPVRVPGTAVFLTSSATEAPPVLTHHVKHNRALHERVVLLTVSTERVPRVGWDRRVEITPMESGFCRVLIRSGFMQDTDVPAVLKRAAAAQDLPIDVAGATYYLGRETFLATEKGEMGRIAETLFGFMMRNSSSVTDYFNLPPEQVVELGIQIDL